MEKLISPTIQKKLVQKVEDELALIDAPLKR